MSRATSTFWNVALLIFVLSLHPLVLIAHPASLQLPPTIGSLSPSLNTTNEVQAYCRYEPEWYDFPESEDLDIAECKDAIQLLIEEDVAIYGSRVFQWSYPAASRFDTPRNRANPRRYVSGGCVLSIWMRFLGHAVDEEIWTAEPHPSGAFNNDKADFQSLARQAYKVLDECVLGSGKSQIAGGTAGWLPSGSEDNMVVALWATAGSLDRWLEPNEMLAANESRVATT